MSRLSDALAEIDRRTDGDLRADRLSRVLYSTDASIYQVEPLAVLLPRSVEDVHAAVEVAAEHELPLLPRASGSSLAGQAVNRALVIDTTRHLDRVLELDVERRRVKVEPGIVLDELNRRLRPTGLMFGPDPASSDRAAIGGVVSNNATGSHSILWGMTADHLIETGVILADGSRARFGPVKPEELANRRSAPGLEGRIYEGVASLVEEPENRRAILDGTPRHWRRCGGYNLDRLIEPDATAGLPSFLRPRDGRFNLAQLVCGGEGGLAVITDVTLGLVPRPAATALALVEFDRLGDALAAVPAILECDPSAVELLDRWTIRLCRSVPHFARRMASFIDGDPECVLIVELAGESWAQLEARLGRLSTHVGRHAAGVGTVTRVVEADRQADCWAVRKAGLGLLMSRKGDQKPIPFIEDAAVPVEHLADYVAEIERFCDERGTRAAFYGHASAGCVHIRPLVDTKRAEEIAKMEEIVAFSVELLRGHGGALSSEHGDGRARSWINERFFGPDLYRLYTRVKRLFDPRGLLNPGTVVDGAPIGESLRFGSGYRSLPVATQIDWSDQLGFDRAVEMCNGAGVCRKTSAGTMCPSFMVTREEEHSTRGRANALRAVLSGRLPADELTGRRLHEVMDLCISCKACKAECPSSVDMARIKLEVTAGYLARHGTPPRDRLFAGIGNGARRLAGPGAPWVNAVLASQPVRWLGEKTLGITSRRPPPRFARRSWDDWWRRRAPRPQAAPRGRVILFVDTFGNYQHPEVPIAATEVIEAAGFEVVPSRHGCCGRPALSKGLVDEARAAARATVRALSPYAEEGVPIVGLEPSCLLTLRDEAAWLLPGNPRVAAIAERAWLFEEWLDNLSAAGELELGFVGPQRRLLLHGHCHQKALVGTGASRRALSLPPGWRVEEVDSGCCGMAGSFGYEAEHYELSVAMAERRLAPAVRAAEPETVVVAPGTSCREQIGHLTSRRAVHPAEVLRGAMGTSSP